MAQATQIFKKQQPSPAPRTNQRVYQHQTIGIPLLLLIPSTTVLGVLGGEYKTVVVRVAVVYMAIFLGLRIWVKHELRDMTPIDWLTLLLLPELAHQAFAGGTAQLHISVIGVASLLALVFIISLVNPAPPASQSRHRADSRG